MENQNPNPNPQKTEEVKPPVIKTTVTEAQFEPVKEEEIPLTVNHGDDLNDLGFLGKTKQSSTNSTSSGSVAPPPFVGQPKVEPTVIPPIIGSDGKITADTVRNGIKVLIIVVDYIMASALRWYAKDTITTPYQSDANQKKILEESLCSLFVEQQAKMPVWLVVVLAFLATFAGGAIMAYQHREKVVAAQQRLANTTPVVQPTIQPPVVQTQPPVVQTTPPVVQTTPPATQDNPPVGDWSKTPTIINYEELKKIYGRLVEDPEQEFSTKTGRPRYGFFDRVENNKWELKFDADGMANRPNGNPRRIKLKYP